MNEEIGLLVRDSLDRLTAGVTVSDGLAARARRGHRQRRAALTALVAVATGTAATAALILPAGSAGAPAASRPPAARLAAYVIAHTEQALAASHGMVVQASTTGSVGGTGIQLRSWSDPEASKTELEIAAGQPASAGGYLVQQHGITVVTIDYPARTWTETTLAASSAQPRPALTAPLPASFLKQLQDVLGGCSATRLSGTGTSTFSWADDIRRMLSCHGFVVAGHGRLDGSQAIKLVPARPLQQVPFTAVLWVDRTSYLPLRLAFIPLPGQPAPSGEQIDLSWLPATASNLAKARILPAPAGFIRLPWPGK
jgi:hypothetical protein